MAKPYVLEEGEQSDWAGMIGNVSKAGKKETRKTEARIEEKLNEYRNQVMDAEK